MMGDNIKILLFNTVPILAGKAARDDAKEKKRLSSAANNEEGDDELDNIEHDVMEGCEAVKVFV